MEPDPNDAPVGVAAVILAAGAGQRFVGRQHKLRALIQHKPVAQWVFDAVTGARFGAVGVVVGAADLEDLIPPEFAVIRAHDWAQGQSHSLQAGIGWARDLGATAVVVGLADQPFVPASAWRAVAEASGPIVTASFDGERRPPVKLDRSVWPLLPTDGDIGARQLIRARADLVSEVACRGNPADIDTSKDLDQWN